MALVRARRPSSDKNQKSILRQANELISLNQFHQALQILLSHKKTRKLDFKESLTVIHCYSKLDSHDTAISGLNELESEIQTDDHVYLFYYNKYRTLTAKGDLIGAAAALNQIPPQKEMRHKLDLILARIWNLFDSGQHQAAIDLLNKNSAEFDKEHKFKSCKIIIFKKLNLRIDIHAFLNELLTSPQSEDKKIAVTKSDLVNLIEYSKEIRETADFKKIDACFDQLKLKYPDCPDIYLAHAIVLHRCKHLDRAEAVYEVIVEKFPFYWPGYLSYARFHYDEDNIESARGLLKTIIAAKDHSSKIDRPDAGMLAKAYSALANTYLSDKINVNLAEVYAKLAIEQNNQYAPAFSTLGKYYKNRHSESYNQSDAIFAEYYFDKARQSDPARFDRLHKQKSDNKTNVFGPAQPTHTQVTLFDYVHLALQKKNQKLVKTPQTAKTPPPPKISPRKKTPDTEIITTQAAEEKKPDFEELDHQLQTLPQPATEMLDTSSDSNAAPARKVRQKQQPAFFKAGDKKRRHPKSSQAPGDAIIAKRKTSCRNWCGYFNKPINQIIAAVSNIAEHYLWHKK